jgi:hypothetical protein
MPCRAICQLSIQSPACALAPRRPSLLLLACAPVPCRAMPAINPVASVRARATPTIASAASMHAHAVPRHTNHRSRCQRARSRLARASPRRPLRLLPACTHMPCRAMPQPSMQSPACALAQRRSPTINAVSSVRTRATPVVAPPSVAPAVDGRAHARPHRSLARVRPCATPVVAPAAGTRATPTTCRPSFLPPAKAPCRPLLTPHQPLAPVAGVRAHQLMPCQSSPCCGHALTRRRARGRRST